MAPREPNLNQKLGILSTITQPLPSGGPHGRRGDQRGPFIVVEGSIRQSLLDEVGRSIEKALVAGGDVALKVWLNDIDVAGKEPSRIPADVQRGDDVGVMDSVLSSYFETILSWRQKSRQITYHVTGGHAAATLQEQNHDKDSKVAQALSTEACTPPEDERSPAPKTPVALVKGGFSLSTSDKYASAMSLSDGYSPVDHWQWIANFWRGMPSPDLIVHVHESLDEEENRPGTVDVSRSMGLIGVRVPAGKGLDEATERRMAFEVMEWMREGPFREEASRSWRLNSF
jgi:hypothetical protein